MYLFFSDSLSQTNLGTNKTMFLLINIIKLGNA